MPTIKNNCSIWTQDWKNVKPVYKLKKSNSSRAVNFGVNPHIFFRPKVTAEIIESQTGPVTLFLYVVFLLSFHSLLN